MVEINFPARLCNFLSQHELTILALVCRRKANTL